jgi:ribosomal protein S18 acetylase RimI-like enzyme
MDPGEDVHDLASHYLNEDSRSSFWVAERAGAGLVGMIGVWSAQDHHGQVRRLLVHPDHRKQGIGRRLVEAALQFCADRGYVKVVLDTDVDQQAAIALFKQCGFEHTRTRKKEGRDVLDFYMDLYSARDESSDA